VLSFDSFPIEEDAEQLLDRRRFLGVAGCAALLVAAGEWTARRFGLAAPVPSTVEAVDAAALASGEARAVATDDGGEALVVKLPTGDVVAFARRCSHLGCPVVWAAARERFECPCHRAAFDARTGRVLFGPPQSGLTPAVVRSA
jgi:nitrite reductase/ring-hydroxylating ferredoxin subunit